MPEPKEPFLKIDRTTLVPIGLLVAVVISAISATVWINTYLLRLTYSVEALNERVTALSTRLDAATGDRWTMSDMVAWVALTAAKNPALVLPDPIHGK